MTDALKILRDDIDEIDAQILALLNQRGQVAQQVGHLKQGSQDTVLRPEREAQIIERLRRLNTGPCAAAAIECVFREIISACRALERRLQIAYLGPTGTFTEHAVYAHFGHQVDGLAQGSVADVFRAVEAGQADLGVVPIENSSEGAVNQTLDSLLATTLTICGEVALPIHHYLMSSTGNMQGIQCISAHPQALAQCRHWLNQHYPSLQNVPATSNAEAARLAASDPTVAAIAGVMALQRYSLQAVASHIQDDPHNRTRFIIVGDLKPGASGKDRTSLILSVANRAGAVFDLLQPLAEHQVSMTRFESRPARTGKWEYYFYIDLDGHRDQPAIAAALQALEQRAAFYKLLGSYPVQ